MQVIENIPLFRTASLPVSSQQAATTSEAATMGEDLTGYVGTTITAAEWAALQAECQHRRAGDWTLYADLVDNRYHIHTLIAR